MAQSAFGRIWSAIKPPPAVTSVERKPRLTVRQKRMLAIPGFVLAAGAVGGGIYAYLASAPDRANRQFQEAMKQMKPGNYGAAISGFTRAISIWPQMSEAYLERGSAYHALGKDDLALADFEQAIAVNPNLARAYSARGSIYRARGDARRAMEEFTRSLNLAPNVDAYYERGQIYEAVGEHQKAIEDFDRALAEMPDSPAVYRARSMAKRNLGDMAGYVADRDKAARQDRGQ
jgi:tetratricopeptide (TPR) repeat protein